MAGHQNLRRVQVVAAKAQRKAVINKVEHCETTEQIAAKAVSRFRCIFTQRSRRANSEKSRNWWNIGDNFLESITAVLDKPLIVIHRGMKGPD